MPAGNYDNTAQDEGENSPKGNPLGMWQYLCKGGNRFTGIELSDGRSGQVIDIAENI